MGRGERTVFIALDMLLLLLPTAGVVRCRLLNFNFFNGCYRPSQSIIGNCLPARPAPIPIDSLDYLPFKSVCAMFLCHDIYIFFIFVRRRLCLGLGLCPLILNLLIVDASHQLERYICAATTAQCFPGQPHA